MVNNNKKIKIPVMTKRRLHTYFKAKGNTRVVKFGVRVRHRAVRVVDNSHIPLVAVRPHTSVSLADRKG